MMEEKRAELLHESGREIHSCGHLVQDTRALAFFSAGTKANPLHKI